MTTVVLVAAALALIIVGIALVLPCPACERRRERLKAAYDSWRRRQPH